MGNIKSYFQLENRTDGTYLVLCPGEQEKALDFREIDEYLRVKHVEYDKQAVIKAVNTFTAFSCVKLNTKASLPENETMLVQVAENFSCAVARFYPPSSQGKLLTKEDIISDIAHKGIRYGLDEKQIDLFLQNRQYCTPYVVAKWQPVVEGKNAVITYHFNTDLSRKPSMNEDGSVDFHKLDTINPVREGDCIATLTPSIMGTPGIDVAGHMIKPASVKQLVLKQEKNTKISEDGLHLISLVNGHVSLIDDSIFVSNSFEVPADVDTSTGDIKYDGSVRIRGNVRTGFSVEATGDVIVDGVVEGGRIISGGQIILKRGIQGMGRGYLETAGSVISKFIENAEVKAGGYVTADAILHSKVTAKGEVSTSGKKGFIVGGEIHSGTGISVKTAGSAMGTTTVLEVGNDPALMEEFHKLDAELPKLEEELNKVNQIIMVLSKKLKAGEKLAPDKLLMLKEAVTAKNSIEEQLKGSLARMDELENLTGNQCNGSVCASEVLYPGCKIILYNIVYHVRSELKYCRLIKELAEVKLTGY